MLSYYSAYKMTSQRVIGTEGRKLSSKKAGTWFLLGLCVGMLAYIVTVFGYETLLFRDKWAEVPQSFSSSAGAKIFSTMVRQLPFLLFLSLLMFGGPFLATERKLSALMLILLAFPFSLLRSQLASMIIAIGVWVFRGRLKSVYTVRAVLLAGIIAVYPLLGMLRFLSLGFEEFSLGTLYLGAFNGGDFDAFAMTVRTAQFVEEYGTVNGSQLLGALLFFVPRTLWTNKPVGSGIELSQAAGWEFNTLSFPVQAEAYLNFGIIGVILMAAAFGYILRRLDCRFGQQKLHSRPKLGSLFYYPLLGLLFLVLRGDMMSSFSFLGMNVALVFFIRLISLRGKRRFKQEANSVFDNQAAPL